MTDFKKMTHVKVKAKVTFDYVDVIPITDLLEDEDSHQKFISKLEELINLNIREEARIRLTTSHYDFQFLEEKDIPRMGIV